MSRTEIRLCGFGGQGIILAGHILGKAAALYDKKHATLTQSYGPESRGGACSAKLIISDEPVHYPHLIKPSILVAMSQEAYLKYEPELSDDGLLFYDENLVKPGRTNPRRGTFSIPATRLAEEELGHRIMANIVMLGFLAAVTRIVSLEALRQAIRTSVPPGTEAANERALEKGITYGRGADEAQEPDQIFQRRAEPDDGRTQRPGSRA